MRADKYFRVSWESLSDWDNVMDARFTEIGLYLQQCHFSLRRTLENVLFALNNAFYFDRAAYYQSSQDPITQKHMCNLKGWWCETSPKSQRINSYLKEARPEVTVVLPKPDKTTNIEFLDVEKEFEAQTFRINSIYVYSKSCEYELLTPGARRSVSRKNKTKQTFSWRLGEPPLTTKLSK